ncbi:antitoxin Xre/MbcA/ParS toxin-binding domain-containing protein [Burkholderia pyrrocinia]|uniref:antitoxin Xre/MbcA/ParS toxin-binding domain-containing protein n=1 Tax=Burkholderia cepacia complex TaxID=87882 RepID=UPI0011E4D7A5
MHADSTGGSRRTGKFREHLRVLRAAAAISGDRQIALGWYQNEPLSAFDGRTAKRLVAEGRADAIMRYLDSIATGWAA